LGALVFSLLGAYLLKILRQKFHVNSDTAFCLVLSSFLGLGVLLTSRVQFVHPKLMREVTVFLCGAAATMTDAHMYLYGVLAVFVIVFAIFFFPQIQATSFDPDFAKIKKLSVNGITFLIALAVVMGIQGVGVVLMAGMLIAPAITARLLTHRLSMMLVLAAIVGAISGFFGCVLSVYLSEWWAVSLPTGPMILCVAAFLTLLSCLFSPKQGLFFRYGRMVYFRVRCLRENILKFLWKKGRASFGEIKAAHHISAPFLWGMLQILKMERYITEGYQLLLKGKERADYIVRLHRLWELYLHKHLGVEGERVHYGAEEMEHVITPELEAELTLLLNNPTRDPHNQPIPRREV